MEGGPRIEAEKVTRIELGPEVNPNELVVTVFAPFTPDSKREIGSGYSLGKNPFKVEYTVRSQSSRSPEKKTLNIRIEGRTAVVTGEISNADVQNIGPFKQGEKDAHCLVVDVPFSWISINDNNEWVFGKDEGDKE